MKIVTFLAISGLATASFSAVAATDLNAIAKWKNSGYDVGVVDHVVAENAFYVVIRQDGGTACPGGTMLLANKKTKTVKEVDDGTCKDNVKAVLTKDSLNFMVGKKLTAKYPLY